MKTKKSLSGILYYGSRHMKFSLENRNYYIVGYVSLLE